LLRGLREKDVVACQRGKWREVEGMLSDGRSSPQKQR
jgi:hypothetical protein